MRNHIIFITKSLHHYAELKAFLTKEQLSYPIYYDPDVEECRSIAKRKVGEGVQAIITTGYLYDLFAEDLSIPIIPIYRDSFSFILCIMEALKKHDRVAILAADLASSTYLQAALDAQKVFPENVRVLSFPWPHNIQHAIQAALKENYHCAIAPSWSADILRQKGIEPFLVSLSERGVLEAIQHAHVLKNTYQERIKNEALISTVLDTTDEGLVALGQDGLILYINQLALRFLNQKRERVLGHHYKETALKTLNIESLLSTKQTIYGKVVPIQNTMVMCNIIPAVVESGSNMLVVTFKPVEQVQEAERKIRSTLLQKGNTARHTFQAIVGNSHYISEAIRIAMQYAKVDSTILITAPSGCGKEVFAQSIHNASPRQKKPFVVINCAALPESILESILFGYAPGAFTGARSEGKSGLFELAHGGTVFLDEVSEMPLSTQARFLRVLQEKEVLRIGSDRPISIDIRVIAATNKNIPGMITDGTFREDLFYRLSVLQLQIPPLSKRREDIPSLANYFLISRSKELNLPTPSITPRAMLALQNTSLPGNVRQLNNLLERAMILSSSGTIDLKEVELSLGVTAAPTTATNETLEAATSVSEADLIQRTLIMCHGNRTETAQKLGISTTTLWRKMKRLSIEPL